MGKKRRTRMKFLLLLILTAVLSGQVYASDCQKIVITSDPDYPPISWRDRSNPEKIIGVAIELIETAFRELGIVVESRYVGPWKRTLKIAKDGKVDMIAGLYLTEERKLSFDYVFPPCMSDPTVVFVMKGETFSFKKWEDLVGLTGGARLGDSYGEKFDTFAKDHLKLERVVGFEQLYKKLKARRNRYMLYGLYPGLVQAEELGVRENLEYLSNFIISEGIYIAFSKQSSCTIYNEFLGKKLQEYIDASLPEALMEKYLEIWREQTKISSEP
jgi:polar amino acid transport system substrate-binding protein